VTKVRCREHNRSMGKIYRATGGFPMFAAHLRGRDYAQGIGDNASFNLRDTTQAEVPAWCPRCGGRPLRTSDLLAAWERRASDVAL
jgi:hypothetical protein